MMDMKKTLLALTLFCPSFFSMAEQSQQARELSKQLTFAVAELHKKVPMQIDEETRLDSAATFGNTFIYNYTMVKYSAEQLDVKLFDKIIQKNVIDTICTNPGLKAFIDLEVVMVYRYLGKNGGYIFEQSFDTKTCKK